MEEPGRLQPMGSRRVGLRLHFHFSLSCTGEGDGNPLQCSCLENPRDRGAWWAAISGVAQSWTRLKRLSSSSSSSLLNLAFLISQYISLWTPKTDPGFATSIMLVTHFESLRLVSSSSFPKCKPVIFYIPFTFFCSNTVRFDAINQICVFPQNSYFEILTPNVGCY